jgi:hypothetical protein
MKFNMEARIPWKEGAVLIFKRLTPEQDNTILKNIETEKNEERSKAELRRIGTNRVELMLAGWEKIENIETGEPLEYNDKTRHAIFDFAMQDIETSNAILTFVRGPLGNLKAGATASSNIDGNQDSAGAASEIKTESEIVK